MLRSLSSALVHVTVSSVTPAVAVPALSALSSAFYSSSAILAQAGKAKEAAAAPKKAAPKKEGLKAKGFSSVERPADAPKEALFRKNPVSNSAARASGAGPEASSWLKDETIEEAYRNLVLLADHKYPPKAAAVHRVLKHVKTKEDLAVAIKALNVALTRGIQLDARSTNHFTNACIQAGDIDAALDRFKDPAKHRMFLTTTAVVNLLRAVGESRDADKLKRLMGLMRIATGKRAAAAAAKGQGGVGIGSGNRYRWETGWRLAAAHAKCGDLNSALAAWASLESEAPERVASTLFPQAALLSEMGADVDAVAANLSKLDAPAKAVLTDKLLPIAKKFTEAAQLKEAVAKVEAALAKAAAAPAAEPAAAPPADAAPAAEAPKA